MAYANSDDRVRRAAVRARARLEHRTAVNDSLSDNPTRMWATPNTMDHLPRGQKASRNWRRVIARDAPDPAISREQVDEKTMRMWPTPKAGASGMSAKTSGRPVEKINTPIDPSGPRGGLIDPKTGRLWPTPAHRDFKGMSGKGRQAREEPEGRRHLPNAAGGNPTGSSGSVGFPLGHTELKDWVTRSSHKYRK